MSEPVRPTKKQRELLAFIERFIAEHGYSPSYREIMNGLNYTSVATVAAHVHNLISRGHVRKRDHSARSLELVQPAAPAAISSNAIAAADEKWLVAQVEHRLHQAGLSQPPETGAIEELRILIAALRILGLQGAAQSCAAQLAALTRPAEPPTGGPES